MSTDTDSSGSKPPLAVQNFGPPPLGGHRAHIVAVDQILAASGGLEPDESVSVDKRNPLPEFAVDGIGGSPSNGSFSMAITNL